MKVTSASSFRWVGPSDGGVLQSPNTLGHWPCQYLLIRERWKYVASTLMGHLTSEAIVMYETISRVPVWVIAEEKRNLQWHVQAPGNA